MDELIQAYLDAVHKELAEREANEDAYRRVKRGFWARLVASVAVH